MYHYWLITQKQNKGYLAIKMDNTMYLFVIDLFPRDTQQLFCSTTTTTSTFTDVVILRNSWYVSFKNISMRRKRETMLFVSMFKRFSCLLVCWRNGDPQQKEQN